MANNYVNFVSDEHLLSCVSNLYEAYMKAKKNISLTDFYKNKVDTFKMTFDAHFNDMSEETLIKAEILRQIDKTSGQAIGTFHEQVLGGIRGFEVGKLSGFDIRATDNSLFADIKNKHNTMNSSSAEALYQKLARYADNYKKAKCYWVQILAKGSFRDLWKGEINGKEYNHSRVYKISGDQFYALLSGQDDAFFQLYRALPTVIADFKASKNTDANPQENAILKSISSEIEETKRSILDQITFDNFSYYEGFNNL